MAKRKLEVDIKNLRWRCNPDWFPQDRSDKIPPADEIIGQERALQAIRTGLGIRSHGYNIYLAGLTGTGKMTTVEKLLEQIEPDSEIPDDICYVYNFDNAGMPRAIHLPAGQGRKLVSDMENMINEFSHIIPGIEENEQYLDQRKALIERYKQKNQTIFQTFEKEIRKEGLALIQVQIGEIRRPEIFPVFDNQAVAWDKLPDLVREKKISEEQAKKLRAKHDELIEQLDDVFQEVKSLESQLAGDIRKLRYKFLKPDLNHWLRVLKKKYNNKKLHDYFDRVCKHINENIDNFLTEKSAPQNQPALINLAGMAQKVQRKDPFLVYRVNVVVDNSELTRPPIIIETAPSYQNLFGTIDHIFEPGGIWKSDFTQIKTGSILQANGGYLVFNFLDALTDLRVWPGLKRVLKNNQIIIQAEQTPFAVAAGAIKPEPINVNLKVLVIGDYYTYQYLYEHDDEFRKIFKIRADFDTEMPNNRAAVKDYGRFISKICQDENLLPLNRAGMAVVVEAGVNLAGRNRYISTRFSDIADIVRESHYWAQQSDAFVITEKHVEQAIQARKERLQMSEEKLQRMILDDILMIETSGKKIGQVNGIAVFDLGDYSFGKPSKITSEVGLGNNGIINIEREAELGGKIYNKGVLIISGYLNGKYAQNTPLTMNASICFEQSYSGVDGDSASAAEIFTLLSSLAQLPLRQDIAVTGSVNQKGEVQPIGGVNQKVAGVYRICKARGLTGKQGVMIPHQNVPDLMLSKELIKSVKDGKFHIYAIKSIDEGIELLTGIPAGKRNKKGKYPAKTVHGMVQQRLSEFSEKMKNFESGGQSV